MDNKSKYRALCKTNDDLPIFSSDWWLDITAGEHNWDVSIVERNKEIVASLPYYKTKKYRFNLIKMPIFTQSMGIWMKYPSDQKYATKLSYEKELCSELIENLPPFHSFYQHFHWSVTNWLPFYWKGFKQSTRYTYLLEDISNLDILFANFRENVRREIRKAQKILNIVEGLDIELFYTINKKSYDRQKKKMPYTLDFLKSLDEACNKRGCRKIWFALDDEGQIHSAIYVVFDSKSAYYLMGGGDPLLRNSGATSLLLWEAIQYASKVTKHFDFEGSMFEPIERFFRGFGAMQKPYFQISKTNGRIMKCASLVKEVFKCLIPITYIINERGLI